MTNVFLAYTQQYIDFNPLIEKNIRNGPDFNILAFPCNQFYLQEPAENHELMNGKITNFVFKKRVCIDLLSSQFSGILYVRPGNGWKPHKNLHIYGKLEVNGDGQHPLYEWLKVFF